MDLGAIYEWVNMGMLNVTKSRAKKYYEEDKNNRNKAIQNFVKPK